MKSGTVRNSGLITLLIALALLTAPGGPARAAGFMVRENDAASVSMVFAGTGSRADDASTVFSNPAGMSLLQGTQLEVGASGVLPNMHFHGSSAIQGNSLPADNSREIGQPALIPHFYGTAEINDRMKVGLAVTVPFGNTVDYGGQWSGRYLNLKTSALALDVNPNISFKLTDWLSLGGGVSLQYLKLDLSSGIGQSLILGPAVPDSQFVLNGHSWDWGYNLGLLAQPFEGTRFGLTYRSQISHDLTGNLKFAPQTVIGFVSAPARAPIDLPATVTASLTQEIGEQFTLSSDVQFTGWHVFKQVSVDAPPNPNFTFVEKYRDSWMISVGGQYHIDEIWTLRAGFAWDESPVTDAYRDTGVPDKDRTMLGVGAGIRLSDVSALDIGYAYYFGDPASMNKSINAVDPITGVRLQGEYNNALNYLSVSYRLAL